MKCCGKPSMECFVNLLGWNTMSYSVIDSSLLVSPSVLFFFRLFVFLFCLFAYVSHFTDQSWDFFDSISWFKYLTHWDSLNMGIYFGLASWVTLQSIKDPTRSLVILSSSKLGCFVHFMFELTAVTAWFVSILYWAALFPIDDNPPQGYWAFINVCMHGLPALFMLLDVILGCGVLVQFHLWMIYLYLIVYLFVNAGVTVGTNSPIYAIMTFKNVSTVIWVVIALALVAAVWFLNYLFIRARTRCCGRKRTNSVVVFSKDAKPGVAVV